MATENKLVNITIPIKYDDSEGLVVGYASKEIIDLENDLVPAEAWFEALDTFFHEGMPIKLLHRPSLTVAETAWLKIVPDGLILASRPLYPEIQGLIKRGLLRGYSIGYLPLEVEERPDGVRVLKKLKLYEISLVDVAANQECYFSEVKLMLRPEVEVHFDPKSGVVTAKGLTPEEMAKLAELLGQSLEAAGVKDLSSVRAIAFKMAEPEDEIPASIASEIKALQEKGLSEEDAAFSLALDYYYKLFDGEELPEEKVRWTRAYINRLPDAAFAVIEPAYQRGETADKNCRHLPHHKPSVKNPNEDKSVDLPHYRNALARVTRIKPVTDSISREELIRRAQRHLEVHRDVLKTERAREKSEDASLAEKALDALRELVATLGPGVVPKEDRVKEEKNLEEMQKAPEQAAETKAPETKGAELEEKLAELEGLKSLPEKIALQEKSLAELAGKVDRIEAVLDKVVEALAALSPKAASIPVVDTRSSEEKEDKGWGLGLDSWAEKFVR